MKKYKFIVMLFILILWFPAFSQETDSEDSDTETLTADSDAAKIIVNKYRLGDGVTSLAMSPPRFSPYARNKPKGR